MTERVAALEKITRKVLEERFTEAVFDDVIVTYGFDHDGDRILNVTAVLEVDKGLEPKELVSFIRHLREALGDVDEFPIVRYILKSELAQMKLASA